MRGKNKSLKRYLRKQRKNVIDPRAVRLPSFASATTARLIARCRSLSGRSWRRKGKSGGRPRLLRAVLRSLTNPPHWTGSNGLTRICQFPMLRSCRTTTIYVFSPRIITVCEPQIRRGWLCPAGLVRCIATAQTQVDIIFRSDTTPS